MTKSFNQTTEFESLDFNINLPDSNFLMNRLTNIYNKPAISALRELISNAIDSIKKANKKTPVFVNFDETTKVISVTDKGTGMSYNELINIYTHYGASTKVNDTESIGEFGLGAKAPLAYTDTFLITTVKDSVEINAAVTKTESVPKLTIINIDKNSNKENGTVISFNYREKDFIFYEDYFEEKISEIPIKFNNTSSTESYIKAKNPFIINGQELDVYLNKNNFLHFSSPGKEEYSFVVGGFLYKSSNWRFDFRSKKVIINLKPNVVDFTSSREEIIYNDKYEHLMNEFKNYTPILSDKEFLEHNIKYVLYHIAKGNIGEETLKYVDKKYSNIYNLLKDKTFNGYYIVKGNRSSLYKYKLSLKDSELYLIKNIFNTTKEKYQKRIQLLTNEKEFRYVFFTDDKFPKEILEVFNIKTYTEEDLDNLIEEEKPFIVNIVSLGKDFSAEIVREKMYLKDLNKLDNIIITQSFIDNTFTTSLFYNSVVHNMTSDKFYVISFGSYGNNRTNLCKELLKLDNNVNLYFYNKYPEIDTVGMKKLVETLNIPILKVVPAPDRVDKATLKKDIRDVFLCAFCLYGTLDQLLTVQYLSLPRIEELREMNEELEHYKILVSSLDGYNDLSPYVEELKEEKDRLNNILDNTVDEVYKYVANIYDKYGLLLK